MARHGWTLAGVLAVCLALVLASVAPATPLATSSASAQDGGVTGRPDLRLVAPNPTVGPGEMTTLSLLLVNDARIFRGGDPRGEARVTTAYNVSIRPRTEQLGDRLAAALTFRTQSVPVGVVPAGVTGPVEFRVAVGAGLPPGRYSIPFAVTYSYVAVVRPNETAGVRTRTETLTATMVVEPRPRLRISIPASQSLTAGESRIVRVAVTNVGSETASEVGLTLSADNGSVYFGTRLDRHARVSAYLPALAPGERTEVAVQMGADDAALAGTYLVAGRATYRDEFGTVRESDWLAAGIGVRRPGSVSVLRPGSVSVRQSGANQSSASLAPAASPAPSRTITAIPVSKSAIASAESSARPTASRSPSS
jgi:hypothetical protein